MALHQPFTSNRVCAKLGLLWLGLTPALAQSEPVLFSSMIDGTDGCVYSNAPTNSHLCCDLTKFTVESGSDLLGKTSFGASCTQQNPSFKVLPFSAQKKSGSDSTAQDPCDFKLADQIYKGLKWECRSPGPVPSSSPSSSQKTAVTQTCTPPDGGPTGPAPLETHQLPAVGPVLEITVKKVTPRQSVPKSGKKTESKTAAPKSHAGLSTDQNSKIKAMLTSPTRSDGAGLTDGCQFEALHQYSISSTGRLTTFYGFCCAELDNLVNQANGRSPSASSFSPNCGAVSGFSPVSSAYKPKVDGSLDSLEIQACKFKGKVKNYDAYLDPPGEVTYCAQEN